MKKKTEIVFLFACIIAFTGCNMSGNVKSESETPSENAVNSGENAVGEEVLGSSVDNNSDGVNSDIMAELEQYYVTEDQLKWEYNSSTKTIIISGEGPMRSYSEEAPEWDAYIEEAEKIVIGDEVTSVGDYAFVNYPKVTEVKLGEKVEYIGNLAFHYNIELRTVNFPASLKYIDTYAFNNDLLHSDTGFVLPEGIKYVGEKAFHSAFKEAGLTIPASLTCIGKDAFANCFLEEFIVDEGNTAYASVDGIMYSKNVDTLMYYPAAKTATVLEIPDTVKTICANAIETTNDLQQIVIPASVEIIEEEAIFWNFGLKEFVVDENNANYKAVDGVLYSKDGRILLSYPIGSDRSEYTVLEGTEVIYPYSMSSSSNLTNLHVSEGVTDIKAFAFYCDTNLSEIGLPASLKTIEESAFDFCNALTRIDYASTGEDWDKVSIGENNDVIGTSATVYPQ